MKAKVLHLALLGPFDMRVAGSSLDVGYAKLRALLAFLAMSAGVPLQREYLAELFWPGMPAAAGRQNLRRALFNLKSAMGGAGKLLFAKRDAVTLTWPGSLWLDVAEFTAAAPSCVAAPTPAYCNTCIAQMERMAGFYRGEFMAGFSLPHCPDFEDWLQLQRESMHRRALSILERLTNCHEQVNGCERALPFALRYTELEPWNEEGHRRAMRLYALNGQSSAALGQYGFCCRMLEKELGVLPGDETRNLAESIRKGGWRPGHPGAAGEPPITVLPPLIAERRRVTVLYCEFIFAATGEPDEAAALLRAPQTRCAEIIRQFSGHIVQVYGGGLLAYFGYPQAHENAVRCAVQAAMAVTREAADGIEIRAGVHTGLVITGGEPSMPDTVGNTSMLTIKLRHGVAHNEVVVSQDTRCLVAGYFDCISMGVQSFPGVARPLEIFKVARESGACTRLDAAAQLTPLAGRKGEIAKLMGLWEKAAQGTCRVVLVRGEAGIGKSRLAHAVKEQLAGKPHAIRELRCLPEFSLSPFYPLIAMLETFYGFAHDDTPEAKFGKLAKYLETHYPASAQHAAPLLAQMLSLPPGEDYRAPGLSPQKQKEQTVAILLGLLRAPGAQQPVLLIVEDLHWIDPSTLELLTRFVEQTESASVLALFTARPEFVPPWKETLATALTLAPLAEDKVVQMIASISGDIPAETIRRIVERADGVPLFVEEMAKIAATDNQANIPATLHDLLAARIDKLGEAKYTAQLATTLGREFNLNLLRKVSRLAPAALAQTLSALQDAGLILEVNETTCQFKHALIQETAYQFQTMAGRQDTHRLIAQSLQSDFPNIAATMPELLAQHLSAGGEAQQAIEYWIKAGQRSALNSANLEAIGHFNSGLQLLMTLPADQERDRMEFKILVSLCPMLYAAKGYGSEGATQTNARISALSGLVGDSPELFHAKWVLVLNTITNSGATKIGAMGIALHLLGMAHDDPLRKQAAHYAVANAAFWLGEFETTRTHAEQAIALHHPDQRQMLLEQFGDDLSVTCEIFLSHALYFLGFPDQAQLVCDRMLTKARKHIYPHTLAFALGFSSLLYRWLNKHAETLSLSAEAILVSRQHDFPVWLSVGEVAHGWALVMHGQEEGIAELKSGIAGMRTTVRS
ncbi:MAG: AAA family ATPase [Nitrosomonadales bacterium]|nr:AAA family ATPase [Nitrosomonadales bacterium]